MRDLIRREDAIDAVLELNTDGRVSWKDAVIDMLDALPSATCDDCIWHVCNYNKIDWDGEDGYISRQDAIEAIESNSYGMGSRALIKAIKALPSAEASQNLAEPIKALKGSDLISRADAIEAIEDITWYHQNRNREMVSGANDAEHQAWYKSQDIYAALESLPSADAVQGEWIEVEVFPEVYDIEGVKTWGSEMQCDQCGFRHTAIEGHMAQYNFCPNCGAKMQRR